MMPVNKTTTKILKLSLGELGTKYASFRFVEPRIEEKIKSSMAIYGQLTPLVVMPEGGMHEIVDGLKRKRASEQLEGLDSLEVRVMETESPAGVKAAMLRLNMDRKGMGPIEEGLLLRAMVREDGLNQVGIGQMLNRHKSWVCRRIALVEQLDEEVIEHMRLGLTSATYGRELAKLPRGNQKQVLEEVETNALSSRECEKLVGSLLTKGVFDRPEIQACVAEILAQRHVREESKPEKKPGEKRVGLWSLLFQMSRRCLDVVDMLEEVSREGGLIPPGTRQKVDEAVAAAQTAITRLRHHYPEDPHG